jgi:hypothetical protein
MAANVSGNGFQDDPTQGWVSGQNQRGTMDIIWSCVLTIFLCCWTSVCPNIPSLSDGRWDQFRDKFNLACIGILGPEFLLGIAAGQQASAHRSVQAGLLSAFPECLLKLFLAISCQGLRGLDNYSCLLC